MPKATYGYENIIHLKNEKHLVGTYSGYVAVNLDKLKTPKDFNIFLNKVNNFILDQPKVSKKLAVSKTFSPEENNFEFFYSVPDYNKITSTKYQYQLLGQSAHWSVPSSSKSVLYENIPYGSYTFKVRAIVGDKLSIPRVGPYDIYFLFSFESQVNTLNLVKNYLFLAGFILLLLIVGITWLVVRQVIDPVRDAAKIAEEFTAGELEKRMSVVGSDEISRLGISFNAMANSIEQQIKRLENLSKVQQRFVSDVSHELRTPLTTIRMASDLIYAYRDKFEPNISRSAELLQSQIDRFELLLADLLEVSRFDATEAAMEMSEIDLNEMVNRCITDLTLISAEKNVVVNLEKDLVNPIVSADARRIERILRNLLTNAIDHANEKPVDVTIKSNSSAASVSIRDYGIGIDPAQVPRVFDRFWRADPARARSRGGTGLGLSIAQEDAHLHNGTLKAWGKLNEGAQFILTLPRKIGWKIETEPIELLTTK